MRRRRGAAAPSSQCRPHSAVLTAPSSQLRLHSTILTVLSSQCCPQGAILAALTSQNHPHGTNLMAPSSQCHPHSTILAALPSQHHPHSAILTAWDTVLQFQAHRVETKMHCVKRVEGVWTHPLLRGRLCETFVRDAGFKSTCRDRNVSLRRFET